MKIRHTIEQQNNKKLFRVFTATVAEKLSEEEMFGKVAIGKFHDDPSKPEYTDEVRKLEERLASK